jgi:hypothetical protein
MARALGGQVNDPTLINRNDLLADILPSPTERQNHKTQGPSKCNTSSVQAAKVRRKSEPVKSACVQCQKRKTKCSGYRPSCRSCSNRDIECSWDVDGGLTRTAGLRKQLREAVGRSEDLCALVDAMRRGTDETSSMLLAKLRIGISLNDLLTGIGRELSVMNHDILQAQEKAICAQWSSMRACSSVFVPKDSGDTERAGSSCLAGAYLRPFAQSNEWKKSVYGTLRQEVASIIANSPCMYDASVVT